MGLGKYLAGGVDFHERILKALLSPNFVPPAEVVAAPKTRINDK